MKDWQRELRDFIRPVKNSQLPNFDAQMLRGARAIALAGAALSPVATLVNVSAGNQEPVRGTLYSVICIVVFGFLYLLATHYWKLRNSDVLLLIVASVTIASLSFTVWPDYEHSAALAVFAAATPLLLAAFAPWRPVLSLLLIVPSTLIPIAAHHAFNSEMAVSGSVLTFVAIMCGVIGATACQIHRRLLLRLEEGRLLAADRLSGLGQMTAGLAHELKTPTAAALNGLETVRSLLDELGESIGHATVTDDDLREIAGELRENTELATSSVNTVGHVIGAIREHTMGMNETALVPFSPSMRIQSIADLLSFRFRRSHVELDLSGVDTNAEIHGDPRKYDQIVTNLLTNAVNACDESGKGSRIRLQAEQRSNGVLTVVEDDGPGVPGSLRERVFDPLFTTRGQSKGTGLGLAIGRIIAEGSFGGWLRLAPSKCGARFELWCPVGGGRKSRSSPWQPGWDLG